MKQLLILFILAALFVGCASQEVYQLGSQRACEAGMEAYKDCEFENARDWFQKALQLDPDNETAEEYLDKTNGILPYSPE